jgi:ATP-dependent DNA helicase DinG
MPTQARSASARQFFSRQGALSQWHPNYEYRAGQVEMAEAVDAALGDKTHLIVESCSGTAKKLA